MEKVAKIVAEVGEEEPVYAAGAAPPGNRLRGIPAIGRGCGGAISGTHPLGALLSADGR
jgi:hypothetical protein